MCVNNWSLNETNSYFDVLTIKSLLHVNYYEQRRRQELLREGAKMDGHSRWTSGPAAAAAR